MGVSEPGVSPSQVAQLHLDHGFIFGHLRPKEVKHPRKNGHFNDFNGQSEVWIHWNFFPENLQTDRTEDGNHWGNEVNILRI